MRLSFSRPQRPHTIYIIRSYRDKDGKSTTERYETLGTEEDIEKNMDVRMVWLGQNHTLKR